MSAVTFSCLAHPAARASCRPETMTYRSALATRRRQRQTPRNCTRGIEAHVVRWQHVAVSGPVGIVIPPYVAATPDE